MNKVIKASCAICGEVELPPTAVRLAVASRPDRSHYAFDCPTCHDEVRKPADDHIISLLRSAHVAETRIPDEAFEEHYGPAINLGDLARFIVALSACDCPSAHAEVES